MMRVLLFLLWISAIYASEKRQILIIGSGPSGIAAATRLYQNGLQDFLILEAENRIGGRVNSTKFGEYMIDLGAEWVHGEVNNAAYELAWPLGLLSKAQGPGEPDMPPLTAQFYASTGDQLTKELSMDYFNFVGESSENPANLEGLKTGSFGEMMKKKINEYFEAHANDINPKIREPLMKTTELTLLALEGAIDWDDVSANGSMHYKGAEGFQNNNWKERAYSTILDIMMKKIPNPEEELPIMERVLLNKKVTKIQYGDGPVKVTTADGDVFEADHVICTVSLGVLKADHEKLFDPPLPEKNVNSVKNLGFGQNAKIFLYYDEPWWASDQSSLKPFFWTEEDRKEIENDPEKSWMLGIANAIKVEWKPKLMFLWLSGAYCTQMEKIPDELFKDLTIRFVQKFFGKRFNVTAPKDIIRSHWNTNENFRGSYGYRSLASDALGASAADLGSPIMRDNKPVVLFAGEATEPTFYATVHGAMTSGWREADRLINFHKK